MIIYYIHSAAKLGGTQKFGYFFFFNLVTKYFSKTSKLNFKNN